MSTMNKKSVNTIVKESLKEKYTNVDKTLAEMVDEIRKEAKKFDDTMLVEFNDAGILTVEGSEPHKFCIRPIVHDIFDCVYIKDGTDRTKKLYIKLNELKKFMKLCFESKENYVDSAYQKSVENSEDKEGTKKTDEKSDDISIKYGKDKSETVESDEMNKPEDDPTEPMREVGKTKKMNMSLLSLKKLKKM